MRCRIVPNALTIGLLVLAIPGLAQPPESRAKVESLLLFLRYVTWPASAFPIADSPLVDPRRHGARLDALRNRPILRNSSLRIESPMLVSARRIVRTNGAG